MKILYISLLCYFYHPILIMYINKILIRPLNNILQLIKWNALKYLFLQKKNYCNNFFK